MKGRGEECAVIYEINIKIFIAFPTPNYQSLCYRIICPYNDQ